MKKQLFTCLILVVGTVLLSPAQQAAASMDRLSEAPLFFQKQFIERTFRAEHIEKKMEHHSRADWAELIDQAWGEGLPVEDKLQLFDDFWFNIHWGFACFQDLDVNWDSLRYAYRSEILDTVSRGRFAAIMNHLSLALKEAHTNCEDKLVCWNTALDPGVPLLFVGSWGEARHFGAGLTPLGDSTLLVYKAIENHPLGLVPGDVVVGYDGKPWKAIYRELLAAQLPLTGFWWGCSPSALAHSWLMSGGMNWHLFDTIDVIKYDGGDTLHFPTMLLDGLTTSIFCTEQIDVPGVPVPDYANEELFSYGIIEGTQIGYIYGWGWFWDAEMEFYDAVHALMFDHETTGMIIDFRMNYGGNMFLSNKALELLFSEKVTTIGFATRKDTADHFSMSNGPTGPYMIPGEPETFYDKPIAVLTGPGAVSSGDQVALRMKFHPRARLFGKSTTAAFNSPVTLDLGNSGWNCRYAIADAFLDTVPDIYLTHDELEVDVDVWHNPDDAAAGIDAVVQAAVDWIDSLVVYAPQIKAVAEKAEMRVSPNPVAGNAEIELDMPGPGRVNLSLYNVQGERIEELIPDITLVAGKHIYTWKAGKYPAGIYFARLTTTYGMASAQIAVVR